MGRIMSCHTTAVMQNACSGLMITGEKLRCVCASEKSSSNTCGNDSMTALISESSFFHEGIGNALCVDEGRAISCMT